jgi:hypothetical protein
MSLGYKAGAEALPGYRLVRPKAAPVGVERWEVLDSSQRRFVARLIPLNRDLSNDELAAFQALREIRHPHILPLLAVIPAPGLVGLISPFYETTLAQRLEDCRAAGFEGMPLDEWSRSLAATAEALDALNHAPPLPPSLGGDPPRHGSVRPESIVVDSGVTRLVDGGVSAVLGDMASDGDRSDSLWRAPEQIALGTANDRSDQYALAMSFFYLRFGHPPLPEVPTAGGRGLRVLDLNGLPAPERPVLERALAKDPLKRWPSSTSFASAWTASLNGALAPVIQRAPVAAVARAAEPVAAAAAVAAPVAQTVAARPAVVQAAAPVAQEIVPNLALSISNEAPPAPASKSGTTAKTRKSAPLAKPAPTIAKVDSEPEQETEDDILSPASIKGWAWSFVMHAILLVVLALAVFAEPHRDEKVIDTRLAGSPFGSELGDQLKGGLGVDTPLEMPEFASSPVESVATFTSLPVEKLNLDVAPVNAQNAGAASKAASSTGSNLGRPGQAGNGDGFGVAKFGQGGENINGVRVKVGDPQFTLIWNTRADIDLHVLEPGGAHIYWESRNGERGGELDVDDVDGFGPENVYWVQGLGPPGEYQWYVHYYGGLGGVSVPTQWKVRLKHNNEIKIFTGKLNQIGQKSQTYKFTLEPPKGEKTSDAVPKNGLAQP